MRRVIAAAVMSGLVLGGVAETPALAGASDVGKTRPTTRARAMTRTAAYRAKRPRTGKATPMKTVVYHGYEIQVPASWPVYRLDENPATCVRYDVHAVYLGIPGTHMRCPPGLVGRTQTVSVIPSTVIAAGTGSSVTAQRDQPDGVGGTTVTSLPGVHAVATGNAAQHVLRAALGNAARGTTVLATYGDSPAPAERMLATLRAAPAGAADTSQSGASQALSRPSGARAVLNAQHPAGSAVGSAPRPAAAAQPTYTSWRGVPSNWPVQIVAPPTPTPTPAPPTPTPTPPKPPKPARPVNGFDTCTAPSLATMRTWRQAYGAVGVYIGGDNAACAYGNLSASWIRSAASMGWGMLPTYVGPQAPCWGYRGALINPGQAASQGRAAGLDAVRDAKLFGLGGGSPIYYDMEAYNASRDPGCVSAVLNFLGAWDRAVAGAGYVTGVYSSQDSGIADLQAAAVARRPGFTVPDAIWFAIWDGARSLNDGTLAWPLADRAKQYRGNVYKTVGGITLDVDLDLAGGPLAR